MCEKQGKGAGLFGSYGMVPRPRGIGPSEAGPHSEVRPLLGFWLCYLRLQAPKHERLQEFFRRLTDASSVATAEAALELIATTLNAVEDDLTDIPADPDRWMTDGRMYPPQPDSAREVPDHEEVTRYRSRGHNTFVRVNGAIEIRDLADQVLFRKAGNDGKNVWKA